ncbi:DNA-directed DNA polymerase [Flavobacteriaceae bacterium UJ101]|nr:DNA-directed DNA polymerase [Flavobacteriaceae bacterium UJ101]
MIFNKIIGNSTLQKHIFESIEYGKVPHAQLFIGPQGVGKLMVAIQYAEKLLSINKSALDKVENLQHADLHFAFPVATNDKVKSKPTSDSFLKEWREFINEYPYGSLFDWYQFLGIENKQGQIGVDEAEKIIKKLALKSYEGGYKIMIIWGADKLNTAASNKLLKIIEEPPAKTVFILIAENEDNILQTIRSRTQLINFKRISDEEISSELVSNYVLDENRAKEIAFEAQGNYNKALKLVSDEVDNEFEHYFVNWIRNAFMAKTRPQVLKNLVEWANEINSWGREKQKQFLNYSLQVFRQALLTNYHTDDLTFMELTESGFNWEKFAPFIHGANIQDILEEMNTAFYHIERNANAKIVFLDLSIKITRFLHKKNS